MLGTPLAFQGDPGKGCERPREAGVRNRGFLVVVLVREAAGLNVSFVLPCPRH